jgi:general secretion pathway protein F
MRYSVKVLRADAHVESVVLEAPDVADARRQASAQGAVLSVGATSVLARMRSPAAARFPLLLFCQELLSLLDSGITIVEAVETLAEKESRPAVRAVLQRILARLREGLTFSAALEDEPQSFPPLVVATVRASERMGGLAEALGRYIAYATQLEFLRGKLVSAAIYPALLVGVSVLVVLFLMGYVVPRFSHIYEGIDGELPFFSRLILQWGQTLEQHGLVLLAATVVAGLVLWRAVGHLLPGRILAMLWGIPAVGERMRVFQLARLYRTLGMLLRGGIPIVPALEMASGLLSVALRGQLLAAGRAVREGLALSRAFETHGLATPVALRMLRVGERAGNMGEMLDRAAAFHDEEMGRWAEWATRLIGPVLMLVMGLVIGGIVVLMYLPIFQLAESIQ